MQFIYEPNCHKKIINLNKNALLHLSVRRFRANLGAILKLANLIDNQIYFYEIKEILRNELILSLQKSEIISQNAPDSHIIQAIFDVNDFYKILPFLNELFVKKITLFYGDFSQKNNKINLEKINKILINSCEQCGRMSLLEIEILKNLDEVLKIYPNACALDFSNNFLNEIPNAPIIIGCEGGFSAREREILDNRIFSLKIPLILRAKTAGIFIASQFLNKHF